MQVPLTVMDFLEHARSVFPDRLAVVDEPSVPGSLGRLTYGELARRVNGMADHIDDTGIGVGERIAIVAPNCAKFLIALFAVAGTGRVLVPINYRLGVEEVRFIVDDSDAQMLLIDPSLDEDLERIKPRHRVVMDGQKDAGLFDPSDVKLAERPPTEDSLATLNYTSGTTAAPKGVMLSHRSHWLNAVTVGWHLGLNDRDVYLHTLPQFHVNGWGLPLASAAMGVANVILRQVGGPEILRRVEAEGVTLLCGAAPVVATVGETAAKLRHNGDAVPGDGMTRMVAGGAPTPGAVIQRFESLTGWELLHGYGLTECGPVLTVNRSRPEWDELDAGDRADRLSLAGAPMIGVQLRIMDDGEVHARTAKAFDGYWQKPDLTDQTIDGGWVRTGDIGQLDDGILSITDRKKDLIISGGENISATELEACLYGHADVADVAVIGVPHEKWGETPKAIVVLREGAALDEAAIIGYCRSRLAHFKCPTSVEFVAALPRTATGKVQKFKLRPGKTAE